MKDIKKTKAQLLEELEEMRQRVAVLEARDAEGDGVGATLSEAEQKLRIVFDSIADGVVVIDLNGKIVEVNESTLRMKGYSDRSEVIGHDGFSFIAEKDREEAVKVMPQVIAKGHFEPREYALLTKSGDEVEVEASCRVLHDKEGKPVGLVCVERDISQRKRLEREKEESRQKLEAVFQSLIDAVTVVDVNGKVIEANEAAARLGGYRSRASIIGKNGFDFIADSSRDMVSENFEKLLRQECTPPMEFKFKDKRGRELDAEATASVLRDSEGKIAGFVNVIRDIRARKQMEERLRSTAEKLSTVLEAMNDGVITIDLSGNITEVNDTAVHMLEYGSKEKLIGRSALDTIAGRDRRKCADAISKSVEAGKTPGILQFTMLTATGREFDAELSTSVLHDIQGNIIGLVGVTRDITERKRAEEELNTFKEALENSTDAIGMSTPQGRHYYQNRAFEQMFGSVGESPPDTVYVDRKVGAGVFKTIMPGGQWTGEVQMYDKDRRILDIHLRAYANKDRNGDIISLVGIHTDITARKRAEKELERHRQKLESMVRERTAELMGAVEQMQAEVTERKRAENELRESEAKYRSLVEDINEVVYMVDKDGVLLYVSPSIESFAGYSVEEAEGRNFAEFIHEEDLPRIVENYGRVLEGNAEANEYRMKTKSGETRWMRTSSKPVYVEGRVFGVHGVLMDITDRRQMEDRLRESEEKLRLMFESIGDGIVIADAMGNVVDLNEAAAGKMGYSDKAELIGRNGYEFIAEKDYSKAVEFAQRLFTTGQSADIEGTLLRKDGTQIEGHVTASLMRDSAGEPTGIVAVVRDITESKRMREELRQSEEDYRTLFESTIDGMAVIDYEKMKVMLVNETAIRMYGFDPKDDIDKIDLLDHVHPDDREAVIISLANDMFVKDLRKIVEFRTLTKDGQVKWVSGLGTKFKYHGKTAGLISFRDITEQKRMGQALRESEEKLRLMFESITDGVTVTDVEGNVVDANDAVVRMFGCESREELIGRNGIELVAERDRAKARKAVRQVFKRGQARDLQYKLLRRGGMEFDVECSVSLMRDGAGNPTGFIYVMRDITERKGLEKEIRDSEESMRIMFESVGEGMLICDLAGRIEKVNHAALNISGYRSEDVIGRNVMDFMLPQERKKAEAERRSTLKAGINSKSLEYTLLGAKGRRIEAEFTASLMRDSEGKPVGIVGTARDISERKRMENELRQSEEKLRGIFDSIRDGIVLTDLELNVVEANDAVVRMAGLNTREELIGRNTLDFMVAEDRERALAPMTEAVEGRPVETEDYRIRNKRGGEFDARAGITMLHDSEGNLSGFVAVVQDVTEQRRMERALEESESRFRELFKHMSSGVAVYEAVDDGEDFVLKDINTAGEKISKLKKKDVIGKSVLDVLPAIREMGLFQVMQRVWKTGKAERLPSSIYKDERSDGWRENYVYKLPSGEVVAVYDDITERKLAELALRESEEKLRFMFDSISDGFVLTDLNGKIIDVNEALARIAGFGHKEELIGRSGFKLLAGKDSRDAAEDVGKALQAGEGGAKEYMLLRDDGCEVEVEATASFLRDAAGNPTGIISVVRDITERKRMDRQLRESEEKLRAMFESIEDGIVLLDIQGVILDVNSEAVRMLGSRSKEEVVGKSSWDFIGSGERGRTKDYIRKAVKTGKGAVTEYTLKDPEGSDIHVESRTTILRDSDGKPTGIVGVSRDITERKRMEGEMRRSEGQMRFMFESIGDGIIMVDLEGNIVEVNRAALRMAGYVDREDMVGRNAFAFVAERDRARALEENIKNISEGHGSMVEYVAVDANGREFEAEAIGDMMRDGDGNPVGFITAVRDISERRRMENELRQSEEKLRTMFGAIRDGIILTDMDDTVLDANDAALRMGKFAEREELIGRNFVDLVVEKDRAIAAKAIVQALKAGRGAMMEYTYIDAQGCNYIGETSSAMLYGPDGEPVGFVNVVRDTTERRRMEEKLRESEEKLRVMFESIADGITVTDMEGLILDVNQEACRILGCSGKEELVGRRYIDILSAEDRITTVEYMKRILKEDYAGTVQYTLPDREGGTVNIEATATVLRDSSGQPAAIVGVARDVTERLRMEEKLRDREERMRTLLQSSPDFVMEADRDGKILFINYTVPEMTVEQAVGTSLYDYISPESQEVYIAALEHIFDTGEPARMETVGLGPGGRTSYYQTRFAPIERDGRVDSVLVIATDITERRQVEEALRESEEKLRIMFATIKDGLVMTDMNGMVVDANDEALRIYGYADREELIGKSGLELTAEEDREKVIKQSWEGLSHGRGAMLEYYMLRKDGSKFAGEGSVTLLSDSAGNPAGIVVLARDVSERKLMETALRESEEMSRGMLESAATGVYMVQDRAFQYVSPLFADISGYTSDELLGTDPLGYVHRDDRERVRKAAIKSLKGTSSLPYEYRFMRKDGETVWILEKVASILYQGKPATIASFMDVTERRQAVEELRRSEEKLRSFMDSATDYFTIWDSELNLLDINEAALKYPLVPRSRDIKREDFIGRNILELEPRIKESGRYKSYRDVIRTGKPFFGEDVYHYPGGDFHLTVSAFKAGEGLGIISTDVTERRRSEEELRSRKEELEKRTNQLLALQKVTTSLQSTLELKEVLQQVAEGVTVNLGYDHSFIMVLDEKEEELKGTVFSTGEKWRDRVGELVQVMGLPLEDVKVPLVKGYSHAVDEGLEGRAVVAHSLCEIAEPPLSREACDAAWKLLESKTAVTLPIMAMERQVGAILAFTRAGDITDVDLEPLRILADQAGVAIVNATIYQGAAEIAQRLAVIGTLSRIVGSSMDIKEVYQAFTDEIKDVIDFDHASIAVVEGEQLRFYAVSSVSETAMGDGTVVPIASSATEWVVDNRRTNIEDDFAVERQFTIDDVYFEEGLRSAIRVPLFYKDEVFGSFNLASRRPGAYGDRERGILEQVAGPIAAAIENSRLFIQVKEHEEQLIKAYDELKVAQDYMVRSERLRALGEMAGGVAHDFNNILAIVLGRAQLALEDVKDEKLKRDLQIIEQTAIDAASTVRRLQDFARVRVDRAFEEVDINQVVGGALEMVESRQMELKERQGIIIEVSYQPGKLAPVLGDASELREALVNILFNSMDAMPQGGRIDIKSRLDGRWVALSISDTGLGMSEETRLRIFEPFFTTRSPRGSGLGLAVTYGIVTRHGGRIEVESSEGKGATFSIRLPVSSGAAVKKKPERKAAAVENARILLVDDDVEVSQVLELVLKQLGHRVTAVNTGEAAVNTFEMGNFDLVITDLGMPDMPGSDVARAVKDIRPGTPVLLITGWGVQLDREELPEVDGLVAKPFSRDTLAAQLAELLAPKKRKKKK